MEELTSPSRWAKDIVGTYIRTSIDGGTATYLCDTDLYRMTAEDERELNEMGLQLTALQDGVLVHPIEIFDTGEAA
jgi:hypothetical protein